MTRQVVDFRNCFANAPKSEGLASKLLATDHGKMMFEDITESQKRKEKFCADLIHRYRCRDCRAICTSSVDKIRDIHLFGCVFVNVLQA
jgi:hypothetical protein